MKMPLRCYAIKSTKLENTRYHVYNEGSDVVSVSSGEWNIKKLLEKADKYEVCTEERCYLCWTFDMAKMPMIAAGEVLVFTRDEVVDDVVVVRTEFDPYDEDLNEMNDLLEYGYAEKINYLEIWTEDDY